MMMPPKPSALKRYQIPTNLVQPLWFRSRESLVDNGLVYDPIAATACQRCQLAPECLSGNIDQKQLLHATLTQLCDQQVRAFIERHPDGVIINVGAGLDTRFYRVDNGRCQWIELDITENLLWRQKLFHHSERYQHVCGSVDDLQWLDTLTIADSAPVLIVCEHALLDCNAHQLTRFIRALGLYFSHASACLMLAGDKTASALGQSMGSGHYQHGFRIPSEAIFNCLPWAESVKTYSPLDSHCGRWKWWQRWLSKVIVSKQRLTPVLVHIHW
ncbi:class I SAM-dependent methyltransferase [Vibrio aestuarianus]|uniref:Class I SAM-dependent methyltransferase n=1 Tax=Vibrio aestuarianus TaxID=28171 RepID=A0A9X4F9X2_9VIBR|nr:class I SAM-dependent methyltransferase [Vibrio aestuarianus]MDE1235494.1 class I SAM-dependent methyltransferase [Vibrio aestuarianus]MDE1246372.1 class I SAM-dependent methyltransferase [Vibrio aestuarianus]MDE1347093.1 class I SAM-dependent methyltransferase [Vibrio aestuarianus]NGZ63403.1 class I SAM-dependent methyltransferase [Vibrio aestuarianus subsp. cardii]NGZ67395.1 class I SAM-dependent methyltransferase [Vibrio aestuarianus subsp. cardii]